MTKSSLVGTIFNRNNDANYLRKSQVPGVLAGRMFRMQKSCKFDRNSNSIGTLAILQTLCLLFSNTLFHQHEAAGKHVKF